MGRARRYSVTTLTALLGSGVTWAGLAAFAPDATYTTREVVAQQVARPDRPSSYADALRRFDGEYGDWDDFGDRFHLRLTHCFGECPEVDVVITRGLAGADDDVRYRLREWNAERDTAWHTSTAYGAFELVTNMLSARDFAALPEEGSMIIDAQHILLSHTLNGRTHGVVWATGPFIGDSRQHEDAIAKELLEVTRAVLRVPRWDAAEREVLALYLQTE